MILLGWHGDSNHDYGWSLGWYGDSNHDYGDSDTTIMVTVIMGHWLTVSVPHFQKSEDMNKKK